jgi:hypothetical protein
VARWAWGSLDRPAGRTRSSPVAQLAEHATVNRRVSGSSPLGGAKPRSRACGATDSRQPALHPVGFVIWFRYPRARRSTDGRIRKSPSIAGTSRYCGATALLAVARASAPRYDRPRHSFRLAASTVDRRPPAARRRPRPSCRLRRAPRWQGRDFLDLGGSAVAVAPRRSAHTLLAQAKRPKRGVPGSSRPCGRAMGRYPVGRPARWSIRVNRSGGNPLCHGLPAPAATSTHAGRRGTSARSA